MTLISAMAAFMLVFLPSPTNFGTAIAASIPMIITTISNSIKVKRKLHAVAGESGKVDVAVAHEASLGRSFIYEGFQSSLRVTCEPYAPPSSLYIG